MIAAGAAAAGEVAGATAVVVGTAGAIAGALVGAATCTVVVGGRIVVDSALGSPSTTQPATPASIATATSTVHPRRKDEISFPTM
ncbi:hypothetical protein AB0J48_23645 [Nocardia salmonicida]|uniref:hypothetical protein n=1 Tax=Nocardia salmonicida TaxID=53431 RepID=UPI00342BEC1A